MSLLSPTPSIGPMQPRTDADERDPSVQDRVAAQMHESFVAKRPDKAEGFPTKNARGTRQRESESHWSRQFGVGTSAVSITTTSTVPRSDSSFSPS